MISTASGTTKNQPLGKSIPPYCSEYENADDGEAEVDEETVVVDEDGEEREDVEEVDLRSGRGVSLRVAGGAAQQLIFHT